MPGPSDTLHSVSDSWEGLGWWSLNTTPLRQLCVLTVTIYMYHHCSSVFAVWMPCTFTSTIGLVYSALSDYPSLALLPLRTVPTVISRWRQGLIGVYKPLMTSNGRYVEEDYITSMSKFHTYTFTNWLSLIKKKEFFSYFALLAFHVSWCLTTKWCCSNSNYIITVTVFCHELL